MPSKMAYKDFKNASVILLMNGWLIGFCFTSFSDGKVADGARSTPPAILNAQVTMYRS